ncbi:MAG: sugar phosphate isomerase/epimerase family protein [Planctomycetota bacterium]|jgi:sugar phosphate isomerase/epimerase
MKPTKITRRQACKLLAGGTFSLYCSTIPTFSGCSSKATKGSNQFKLDYIIASSMYGCLPLSKILPQVPKAGAEYIDIWPQKHGNQREQMDEIGHDKFAQMLDKHNVKLGMLTRYDLGPFGLQSELEIAKRFGTKIIITGSQRAKDLTSNELKKAVKQFAEKMKPHTEAARKASVTIGIENHGHALICSPDSISWFAEFTQSQNIGIALAPYHLPQQPNLIADLIKKLGKKLVHFYAWQYGQGCMKKMPKELEMLQMPGYGPMDFVPIVKALKQINYTNWTSVFMHPTPRGIPILPTAEQVTEAINKSNVYLNNCIARDSYIAEPEINSKQEIDK